MKILIHQFLGKNHSWSVVGWGIAGALIQLGHQVHLFSTDGIKNLPAALRPYLIGYHEENNFSQIFGRMPDAQYDCQISYTGMKNFPMYLSRGNKNRFGIWCYEFSGKNVLPSGFAKHYRACDHLCAPSNFAKRVFMESGIPENGIKVIPHGIDTLAYQKTSTLDLHTKKSFKILANIAQNHLRKNIPGLLAAYGKAFSKQDDVCLILKAKDKPATMPFEVSLKDCLSNFNSKFPNHAEVKVFSEFVDDMSDLYRSVDAVFTMSHCEGFYFPGLEGLAAGKVSIAPNWGGQVDFLNSENSLLIDGKEGRANPHSMYWESKNNAIWFVPSVDDAANKLRYAYQHYQSINDKLSTQKELILSQYSWTNIASQFLQLCT